MAKTPLYPLSDFSHQMIMARLRSAGSGFSAIARELGITPSAVSLVSKGDRCSRRVQQAIADKLGVAPVEIWPARYPVAQDEEGSRNASQHRRGQVRDIK